MLKIEKSSKRFELKIREREKNCWFNRQLLQAFAYALALHMLAYALFHIKPFFVQTQFLYPPVEVAAEGQNRSFSLEITKPQTEEWLPPWPQEPLPDPRLFHPSMDPWFEFHEEAAFFEHAIAFVRDKEALHWFHTPPSLRFPPLEKRLDLTISGDLREIALLESDAALEEELAIESEKEIIYANYLVYLDAKRGEIFWFDRLDQDATVASFSSLFEKIIRHLKFLPSQELDCVSGTLHFQLKGKEWAAIH